MWILAFDFGMTRIGVAVGNSELKIPHPQKTIIGRNKFVKLEQISQLVKRWQPELFVVGMPSVTEDKEELIKSIKKFANRLQHNFNIAVEFVNEDYTSHDAAQKLQEQAVLNMEHKDKVDALAACAILNRYFSK